ncbi:MAG TPA: jacalin-like lectin, partial [Pyrinomonadaceae bacterium]|nr:jacalin-like lectin [Pyrinomonadaceae bacterium]
MAVVSELGLRSARYVDQIRINGTAHGRNGGSDQGSITLGNDEYISKVEFRSDKFVDYVKFTTSTGRSIYGGGDGGYPGKLEGIRVLAIGGRSGAYVDKLDVMY